MGNQNTKVVTKMPRPTLLFPFFPGDKLETYQASIAAINSQLMNITQWVTEKVMPPGCEVIVQIVSTLLGYLLQYVVKRYDTPKDSEPLHCNLQEALICSKVDDATAQMATYELRAKVFALKNRYSRLLSNIPDEDKKFEIVPALQTCEEILDLFRNQDHVFWKRCFISIPFLVSFASLYAATAMLSVALIPSYTTHLVEHSNLLRNILMEYKDKCINLRLAACRAERNSGESLIEAATAANFQSSSFCVVDKFLENYNSSAGYLEDTYRGKVYDALELYKKCLIEQHDLFFKPAVTTLDNFINIYSRNL